MPHNRITARHPARRTLALAGTLALAVSAAAQTAAAQTATPKDAKEPPQLTALFNRNIVFIDPAHGGPDSGAHLTNTLLEKDITLALALRLRDALTARGFTVVLARQADDPNSPTLDDRAGMANHLRPVACILIHATNASRGVHFYASSLTPPESEPRALPWDTAQASWAPQSLRLANELGTAIARTHTPVLIHRADPRPLSSLTCPAIALEIAPLPNDGANPTPVADSSYQDRLADAIATGLTFWKNHADPAPRPITTPAPPEAPAAPRPTPKPTPKPKPSAPAATPDKNSQPVRVVRPLDGTAILTSASSAEPAP